MTKARFLREHVVRELYENVPKRLQAYRTGKFQNLETDLALSFQSEVDVDYEELSKLKAPKEGNLFEVDNCIIMLDAFPKITPAEASDQRLWVMLSHTCLLKHARKRWPISENDDEAVKSLRAHFFANSSRRLERDNVASRLWWQAHLCDRLSSVELRSALRAFLYRADVRAQLIDRSTTSQNLVLFEIIIKRLIKSIEKDKAAFKRQSFRTFMETLNALGGYQLLDAMDKKTLSAIVKEYFPA